MQKSVKKTRNYGTLLNYIRKKYPRVKDLKRRILVLSYLLYLKFKYHTIELASIYTGIYTGCLKQWFKRHKISIISYMPLLERRLRILGYTTFEDFFRDKGFLYTGGQICRYLFIPKRRIWKNFWTMNYRDIRPKNIFKYFEPTNDTSNIENEWKRLEKEIFRRMIYRHKLGNVRWKIWKA